MNSILQKIRNPITLVVLLIVVAFGSVAYYEHNKLSFVPSKADSAPCTGSNCINVDGNTTYQTMVGWEGTDFTGYRYTTAWNNIKNQVFDSLANDLGINRVRLEVTSGIENNTDYYTQWINGQITENDWITKSYEVVNDNSDPNSINASGFQWSSLDDKIDNIILPLKQKVEARGEHLYINVNFVDFKRTGNTGYQHKSNPAEYAEFVLAVYQHMQARNGIVPDSWEVILEPDTSTAAWSAAQTAAAVKAAGDRLVAAGFTPHFVVPSVTSMNNALSYISSIENTSGAMQYVDTFSYHLYGGQSTSILQQIAAKAAQYGKNTAELEYIGATYLNLQRDLIDGKNSSWAQYTLSTLAAWGANGGGGYYDIDDSNPNAPTLQIENQAKFLRQYFKYIRSGAVRVGATNTGNPFIEPLAFRNTDGKYVVVTPVSGTTSFGVNGLPAGTYGVFYTATSNNATVYLADQTIPSGGSVSLTNIPAGVVTVYATTAAPSDTTPPVLSSGSPTGAQPAGTTSVNLSVTTDENATCKYGTTAGIAYASIANTFTTTGSVSHSKTLTGLTNGTSYTYYVRCQDSSSNANTSDYTISFSVSNPAGDTTPPTVSVTAPSNNATVSGSTTTVSATATDNVGVVGVQFKLDGTNLGPEDTSSPYSISWDTTGASNASHTLTAVARDAAGNSTTSTAITVTVNNAVPPSTVSTPTISPNGGTFNTAQSVTLTTATSGASIHYTTDSSTPTSASTLYSSPFQVATTATVKAIAIKSGSTDSSVSSATFTIATPPIIGGGGSSGGGGGSGGSGGGGGSTPPTTPPSSSSPRLVNSSGTYYFIESGLKKGITSPGILYSCGFEFKDAKTATSSDLTLPSSLLLPCGGALVKSVQDPTVYLISQGKRYAFTSSTVFTSLGFKFSSVLLVTDPELQALPKNTELNNPSAAHLPDTDINYNGTVYWIDTNHQRHPYPSLDVYNSWHKDGDFTTVVPANQADLSLTTGSTVTSRVVQ